MMEIVAYYFFANLLSFAFFPIEKMYIFYMRFCKNF